MKTLFNLLIVLLLSSFMFNSDNPESIMIGGKEWTSKNLSTTIFLNGDNIPQAHNISEWKEYISDGKPAFAYCDFNKLNQNLGFIYNYYALIDGRGLCDKSWHVPTVQEWKDIDKAHNYNGANLKSQNTWIQKDGTNTNGFSAIPTGCIFDGVMTCDNSDSYWWTMEGHVMILLGDKNILRDVGEAKKEYGCFVRLCKF